MKCEKCAGHFIIENSCELGVELELHKCLSCGNRVDKTISMNRENPRRFDVKHGKHFHERASKLMSI